jgi:putative ABC transport system permease protein
MLSHLRYAIRLLFKSPGFTIATVLIMGLGIGANTAIFSVVHAVLLQSLPYPDPEKLFMLTESGQAFPEMSIAYPNYLDWRSSQTQPRNGRARLSLSRTECDATGAARREPRPPN